MCSCLNRVIAPRNIDIPPLGAASTDDGRSMLYEASVVRRLIEEHAEEVMRELRAEHDAESEWWSKCDFCGLKKEFNTQAESEADTTMKDHSATCSKHPAVIALAQREAEAKQQVCAEIRQAYEVAGGVRNIMLSEARVILDRYDPPTPSPLTLDTVSLSDGRTVTATWTVEDGWRVVCRERGHEVGWNALPWYNWARDNTADAKLLVALADAMRAADLNRTEG